MVQALISPVNVVLGMRFSSTCVYGWLCGFAGLFFQSCYAGDPSPLSLTFLPSSVPLSPSLSIRTNDGTTLGVSLPASVFGVTSKRETLQVIFSK